MSGRRHASLVAALAAGCIIPDTGIEARGESVNPGPVRLVQAVPLSPSATDSCPGSCPLLPATLSFGLIRADAGDFCSCPELDGHRINYFDIYAEDPDVDGDGNPTDAIYGAFLLDVLPGDEDPSSFVAYENLLSPTVPATPEFGIGSYANAVERPTPQVRRWTIDDGDGRVDLCNNNASAPVSTRLVPGLHSLRLIVTDRPWYRPFEYTPSGEIVVDDEGERVRVPVEQAAFGVPDTPSGASYAIADYVFRCADGFAVVDPGDVSPCQCVAAPVEGGP